MLGLRLPGVPNMVVLGGATKVARTNVNKRVRSVGEAKGTWVARRPQEGKHPLLHHHATQNSWPASLDGGRLARRMLPMPLRSVRDENSVSSVGLSTRETAARGVAPPAVPEAPVMEETPDPWLATVPEVEVRKLPG
jgi:hypothetical protein